MVIDGVLSEPQEINYGVPQGSVLGSIFFLVFMNDITKVKNHSQICLFGDDKVIYNSNQYADILEYELQKDLDTISIRLMYNNERTINI